MYNIIYITLFSKIFFRFNFNLLNYVDVVCSGSGIVWLLQKFDEDYSPVYRSIFFYSHLQQTDIFRYLSLPSVCLSVPLW